MTEFEEFYQELVELAERFERSDIPLKIERDLDCGIIKIFGEKITPLARAQNGLNDLVELAYSTAEHHPYWNLLYNSSEIASTVLDRWGGQLSEDDFDDIKWALEKINQTLEKIKAGDSS